MPSARESRAALELVTTEAVSDGQEFLQRLNGTPEAQRLALLDSIPGLIGYYADGSAALAADFYDESRALAGVKVPYTSEMVVADRVVKIRRAIAWSAEPLFTGDGDPAGRLAEVIQLETARPYRDTIVGNRRKDPASVGWKRIANPGACRFCRFLAARGAIYKQDTATFASHPHCFCSAAPVFKGGETGPEATAEQYIASRRKRTAKQQDAMRNWLDYFDETGKTSLT